MPTMVTVNIVNRFFVFRNIGVQFSSTRVMRQTTKPTLRLSPFNAARASESMSALSDAKSTIKQVFQFTVSYISAVPFVREIIENDSLL
ncbi:hypothetical protein RHMOL_Rhmol05G0066000 [Rhododendron molle]|uniref:Uncharacterized protein n=1 Tax=Rhododendron molle TaxID=49168 RepID=A0ACC0NML7_RHOML|nr:hypothetical protein RHMOL_Rhmol05G0066000 [Rhododendron molle]